MQKTRHQKSHATVPLTLLPLDLSLSTLFHSTPPTVSPPYCVPTSVRYQYPPSHMIWVSYFTLRVKNYRPRTFITMKHLYFLLDPYIFSIQVHMWILYQKYLLYLPTHFIKVEYLIHTSVFARYNLCLRFFHFFRPFKGTEA